MPRKRAKRTGIKRSRQLNVRVTDEEYELIRTRADVAGRSVTDYVVWRCVYMDRASQLPPKAEVASLYGELVKQGTNLNQIAHACNRIATMDLGDLAARARALRDLEVIRLDAVEVRKTLESCYNVVMDAWSAGGMVR